MAVEYKRLWIKLAEKDISKAAFREMCDISPATMTKLNKNNYVTVEVLEKICRTLECDIGDIVSLIPEDTTEASFINEESESGPFHLRFISFVGRFPEGRRALKKTAYFAGGAPSDKVRAFTEYLVIGEGGEETRLYKAFEKKYIKPGYFITLTPQQLKDIAEGRTALPEPKKYDDPDFFVISSERSERDSRELRWRVWNRDRDQFRAELVKAEPHIATTKTGEEK